jgi:hypothetical protein
MVQVQSLSSQFGPGLYLEHVLAVSIPDPRVTMEELNLQRLPFSLPLEIQSLIVHHLPNEDKISLRQTCKIARNLVDECWKPLRGICIMLYDLQSTEAIHFEVSAT